MTENEERGEISVVDIFEDLSEELQDICCQLVVTDWQTGESAVYFEDMGFDMADVKRLVDEGILVCKPGYIFAQEYLDQHMEEVGAIRTRIAEQVTANLSPEESALLNQAQIHQLIVDQQDEELRYRLVSTELRDYILENMDEDLD